jgi:hypothetical protein
LKLRSRQKDRQAVVPIAKSAMPTSNWSGLTCQLMKDAAIRAAADVIIRRQHRRQPRQVALPLADRFTGHA